MVQQKHERNNNMECLLDFILDHGNGGEVYITDMSLALSVVFSVFMTLSQCLKFYTV